MLLLGLLLLQGRLLLLMNVLLLRLTRWTRLFRCPLTLVRAVAPLQVVRSRWEVSRRGREEFRGELVDRHHSRRSTLGREWLGGGMVRSGLLSVSSIPYLIGLVASVREEGEDSRIY